MVTSPRLPNFNHLYYFHIVASEGSLAKAASRLRVTQPTISTQIRQLEESVGHRLFERSGRGMKLTANGEYVVEHTSIMFRASQRMIQGLQPKNAPEPRSLAIGIASSVANAMAARTFVPLLSSSVLLQIRHGDQDDTPSALAMFNRRPVDLIAVVERTLLCCPGGVRIRFAARPDGPAKVNCDESRIALVVSNLIRNAVEHGTGAVEVRVLPSPGGWTLTVDNDGAIGPSRDPLVRSPGDDHAGAGLGLYLVRQFVKAHGGNFSISSDGHRVEATVFLPA